MSKQYRDSEWRQNIRFFVEVITVIAVVTCTAVAIWQAMLTRDALRSATKQFQSDQRPLVWTNKQNPFISIAPRQKLWANIAWTNYGKTPAVRVRGFGIIFIGADAGKKADDWFNALGDQPLSVGQDTEFVIAPGGSSDSDKTAGEYSTITSEHLLTQEDVDYINRTEESFVMAVRLEYFDAIGNRYWSDVCMSRFTVGSVPQCVRHNNIH